MPRKTELAPKQETGNFKKSSRKQKENQPGPPSREVEQHHFDNEEPANRQKSSEKNNLATANQDEVIPEKYKKHYINITLEQFKDCSNIAEVVTNEIKRKRPNSWKRKLIRLDTIIKDVYGNYKLCPLYRKIPLFGDLKFDPKPWLTKNDKKLLDQNKISPCSVDMESKNIVKYIEKQAIHKEQQKKGFKGYNCYNFNNYIPSNFNKKVRYYGGFDIACERLLEKQQMENQYITEIQTATDISNPSPKTKPIAEENIFDKNEKIAMKSVIARPCPLSRKVKETQITEVNDTNEDWQIIAVGLPAPLSQMAKQRGIENKKVRNILDKNVEIMTKPVIARPCPKSRKPKEIRVTEKNNIDEDFELISTERPAPLLSQKQRDIESNTLDNNKKIPSKSVIVRPCPLSRKPKAINEYFELTTNKQPLSQMSKQRDIKNNNVSNTLDKNIKITSKSVNARLCPISRKRKVPEVNNLNEGNDVITTEGPASSSQMVKQTSIENKKVEVPRKLARRRKINADRSETESSEKDISDGESYEAERLTKLKAQDLLSAGNTQYHIFPSTSKGNFCGRNTGSLAYIDDSSSDDDQPIMQSLRNAKINKNLNNERSTDSVDSIIPPRGPDDNIVLSEAQPIFLYTPFRESTESSNHLWEDNRSLSSKPSTSSKTSNFSQFKKPVLQKSVGTSTSDLESQYNIVNDNLVNCIPTNIDQIFEVFDVGLIFKSMKARYHDYDDNYLNEKTSLCKQLFRDKRSITINESRLENAHKPPDKTDLLSKCNKIQEANVQPLISGSHQDNPIAAKENDEINKNKEKLKKSKKKVYIISNEVLKAASKPGESFVSFNNKMEFVKHTNIKDYLEKDIRKKFPETYKKYLPKMEKLINRFYNTYILNKKAWPSGLIVDTNYIHTNVLDSLATCEKRKESGADERVKTAQSIQELPTLGTVLENPQNQEKETSLVIENNATNVEDIEANFKTFQKQLTFEQFTNCTNISHYIKNNILNKYSTLLGYYKEEFQKLDRWPEGLELNYEGVKNFFKDQVCQQNKSILLTQSTNESCSGNSQRNNLSDDLFPSSNETIKTRTRENHNINVLPDVDQEIETTSSNEIIKTGTGEDHNIDILPDVDQEMEIIISSYGNINTETSENYNIDILPDVDQEMEIITSSNGTIKTEITENHNIDVLPDVGQVIEITTTPFNFANSSSSLENTQENPSVTISQNSSSIKMVHPKDLNIKNLCSGRFPRNGRSYSNGDDEYSEQEIKDQKLESSLRTDTFNKDIIKLENNIEIASFSDYGDDVEIVDNITEQPIIIDDTIETAEDILDEMCNIDKNVEAVSKDNVNNLIENNHSQGPIQEDVIDAVDEILNEMFHSPEEIISNNSEKTDVRNDVASSNILSESNLLVSLDTDQLNDLAANNILSESNRLVSLDTDPLNDLAANNILSESNRLVSLDTDQLNDLAANNILSESNRLVSLTQLIDEVNEDQDENVAPPPKNDYIPEKNKAKKIAVCSNSKVTAAPKSDFVPQARHNFGELEFISRAKYVNTRKRRKSFSETAAKPLKIQRISNSQNQVDIDDPDYRIEDVSGIRNLFDKISSQNNVLSDTQLLNNDNTYFTSTLILAASESSAITKTSVTNTGTSVVPTSSSSPCITSEIIPPKDSNQKLQTTESNQVAVKKNVQTLQGTQKRDHGTNQIYRQLNSKIFVYITYLSLYEIKCDKKLNSLQYESSVPFLMPFEKQPIQSTILFRSLGFNKLNVIGDSLKLILGFNDNEWKCLLNILQVVGTFEYCINDPEPRGKSLPFRLLYLLFKSLPHFSQITLEIADSNINQAKCVKFSNNFYEPYTNLVDVFSPSILKFMAQARNELFNKVL